MEKRKRENGHLEVDEQLYGGPGTSEREKRQGKPGKVSLGLCPVSDKDNGNTEKGNVGPLPLELRKAGCSAVLSLGSTTGAGPSQVTSGKKNTFLSLRA